MPIFEVELSDGRVFEVESDAPPSQQDVMAALGPAAPPESAPAPPEEQGSGGASATLAGARALPALKQGVARFAANHPAATQKIIGAGISTAAGGVGATVGGVPGAVVGASIRGVTPAQTVIRETAGRMAGEAPAVAQNAARALGIQNYAKETTGLRLKPTDIIPKPNAANALEHYANSMEKGVLRLYGPSGEVVSGPNAVSRIPTKPAPGMLRTAGGAVARGLAKLSGPVAMTDLAQTLEPTRTDIGVMGIGASQPDPSGEDLAQLDARNKQAMQGRLDTQAQQRAEIRARVLALLTGQ
jgi:hypothetical protein